jgi:hypothetical protein
MARSLAINHHGHLCKRRRGGGAEHRIQDVDLNGIDLITIAPGNGALEYSQYADFFEKRKPAFDLAGVAE